VCGGGGEERANAAFDFEACFVPAVEGKEDGVVGVVGEEMGEVGADCGGDVGACVGVVEEETGGGLEEEFVVS